jgi:hypothetical protein
MLVQYHDAADKPDINHCRSVSTDGTAADFLILSHTNDTKTCIHNVMAA